MAKQIISGGFKGEEKVRQALNEFTTKTGIDGTYKPTGQYENMYRITSGGFYGKETVLEVLQKFKDGTGINGTYEPTGDKQNFYKIITGGFPGEDKVVSIIQQIKDELGINATFERIPSSNSYRIIFNKVESGLLPNLEGYLKSHNWWYSTPIIIESAYTHYRIKSEPIKESEKNVGLQFFNNNGWYASFQLDQKIYSYRIITKGLTSTYFRKGS